MNLKNHPKASLDISSYIVNFKYKLDNLIHAEILNAVLHNNTQTYHLLKTPNK
ncbi:4223_t:CDS:1, partial [Gigaspora rosea]